MTWFFNTYLSLMDLSISTEQVSIYLVLALVVIGIVSLFIRKRDIALLLVLIPLMALMASALQMYPLKNRFMLFLIPPLLLILSEGLRRIFELVAKMNRSVALVLSVLPALWLVFFPVLVTFNEARSSHYNTGVRPVIEYVAQNRMPNDFIYAYQGAEPTFLYYAPLFGIDTKSENVIVGKSTVLKRRALNNFFKDVDALQGRERAWFIFADIVDCGGCEGDMQAFYVDELNKRGVMLDQSNGIWANAYLYDMNR
jgi:hypothetical protein